MTADAKNWPEVNLASVVQPRRMKASPSTLGSMPFIGLEHVEAHSAKLIGLSKASDVKSAVAIFETGDVLYGRLRPYLNKVVRPTFSGCASAEFIVLPGNDKIDAAFLQKLLMSDDFVQFASHLNQGDRPRVDFKQIGSFRFRMPPLPQQRHLVARIDRLRARTTAASGELSRIPRLIERYKQAILAAAFRGELTAAWRSSHNFPSPPVVLLNDLCLSIADGDHQAPPRVENGIPFITISAMNNGQIDLSKATRYVPRSYARKLKLSRRPIRGDVLFSVTGSIGIPALVTMDDEFVFQRHIAILRPDSTKTSGRYVNYLLAAPQVMEQALSVATGTAQLTIPLSGLRDFRVPLPSLQEQSAVIRYLDSQFASLEQASRECARASALIERMERATLSKAFSGDLPIHDSDIDATSPISTYIAPSPKRDEPKKSLGDQANRRPSVPSVNMESAREAIRTMPADRFSFDDLRAHLAADYETLREIVFGLLDESNPVISQVFDSQKGSIVFSRGRK